MMRVLVLLLLLGIATTARAGPRPLPFGEPGWALEGEGTSIVREDGRDILLVQSGSATRRDVGLEDGTLEFDVKVTARRSFVYCNFRIVDEQEREELYLRPHKSNLPDAMQYAPVYQGRSGWQLYHGPGKTGAVDIPHEAWTHVRLLLRGPHAALFVGDMQKPALVMRLARTPRPGPIGFAGFLPADMSKGTIARFANVVVDAAPPTFDFAKALPPQPATDPGTIRAWAVSKFFAPRTVAGAPAPPDAASLGDFTKVDADPDGLVELHRVVAIPPRTRAVAAVTRFHVRAARAGTYVFDLGFSDIATVFLNGRPIFRGDGTYAYDNPRREGLVGFDQARLYLPLNAGDNEVGVEISDVFGGWAVMGRFVAPDGLQVEAR